MTVRIGLTGAGRMGATLAHHLAFSVEPADFVAIADADEDSARKVAHACRVADIYTDYNELLARADIDAVLIVTPTNSHTAALGVKHAGTVLRDAAPSRVKGLAFVFSTHNPHHAYAVGDRFAILKRGRTFGPLPKKR